MHILIKIVFLFWRLKKLIKNNEDIPYSKKRWRGSSYELSTEVGNGSVTKEQQEKHDKFVADVKKLINDKNKSDKK